MRIITKLDSLPILVVGLMLVVTANTVASGLDKEQRFGKRLFKRYCATCHYTEPNKDLFGPSLWNIVDKKAASVKGFPYSKGLKTSELTWDKVTLDKYLTSPNRLVKGTQMVFPGVKKKSERDALIRYLCTLR